MRIARYGVAAVKAACKHSIEYAERRFREEVASWPDGTYEADAWVDHDPIGNPDIHVHVAVTVDGDKLTVDFTGSDTRPNLKAYSSFGNTRGYVVAQLASMMDPSIPKNEGFFESIELIVPKGCVLNPEVGKTVAAGTHHPGVEVGEAICKALAKILPMQMPFPSLSRLLEPYGYFSPMGVLWASIGASRSYEVFTGAAEMSAAILLFVRPTATLGALVALACTIMIFTLNMTYDVPVKLFSFHLLVMSLFLLAPEAKRLVNVRTGAHVASRGSGG